MSDSPQIVEAQVLLYNMYTNFPMGTEIVTAVKVDDINLGTYYQLDCTQNKYSFDYYAIYPPISISSTSAESYITRYGFIAAYDPRTRIYLNTTGSILVESGLLKAVYR
jgi:hypothetical protein